MTWLKMNPGLISKNVRDRPPQHPQSAPNQWTRAALTAIGSRKKINPHGNATRDNPTGNRLRDILTTSLWILVDSTHCRATKIHTTTTSTATWEAVGVGIALPPGDSPINTGDRIALTGSRRRSRSCKTSRINWTV